MSEVETYYGSFSKDDTYKMGFDVQAKFDDAYKAVQDRDTFKGSAQGLTQKQIDALYEKHDRLADVADNKIFKLEQAIGAEIRKGYSFKDKDYTNAPKYVPEVSTPSTEVVAKPVEKQSLLQKATNFIKTGIVAIGNKIKGERENSSITQGHSKDSIIKDRQDKTQVNTVQKTQGKDKGISQDIQSTKPQQQITHPLDRIAPQLVKAIGNKSSIRASLDNDQKLRIDGPQGPIFRDGKFAENVPQALKDKLMQIPRQVAQAKTLSRSHQNSKELQR